MNPQNESAISFNWLKERAGLLDKKSQACQKWERIKNEMLTVTQQIISLQDWASDYWICKGFQVNPYFVAKWAPPDALDEWPSAEINFGQIRPTNHRDFLQILSGAKVSPEINSNDAVREFYLWDDVTATRGDVAMHKAQYVRAWLFTALGPLLMSIPLSPQDSVEELSAETINRLFIPKEFKEILWGVQFSEGYIETLYNCRKSVNGNLSLSTTQVGQGDEWMKHWQWLSKTIDAGDALEAVQLSARMLRSVPLL